MIRIALAALHLVALGLGVAAIRMRANALRESLTVESLRRAFKADSLWGMAFGLWVVTGVWRWLAGTEKSASYYLDNHLFLAKMAVLVLILGLEVMPMITLIRWRRALKAGQPVEQIVAPDKAKQLATISGIQAILVIIMVFLAVSMARGYGARP